MRIANVKQRLTLVTALDSDDVPQEGVDVNTASSGMFGPSMSEIYPRWTEFREWAQLWRFDEEHVRPIARADLGAPSPMPAQVFAIGLNYQEHVAETDAESEVTVPPTFTKFPNCLTGPFAPVQLPSAFVDWEVEMVAVIGKETFQCPTEHAWEHIAGLTIGQDLSERAVQMVPPYPQFSLAKSYPGFGPTGPALVTVDEVQDRDDLELSCDIGAEDLQRGRTSQMIFDVPKLIAMLSSITRLLPGDIVFTGTPSGVGMGLHPPKYLVPGQVLTSRIGGLGMLENNLTNAR